YRGQYELIKLAPGQHTVTLKVASAKADKCAILGPKQLTDITHHPEKYDATRIYLGRILLRGKPLTNDWQIHMKVIEGFEASGTKKQQDTIHADFIITGGGLSGVCAAITAARQGLKVVLVQDRPVLGGNASSEVRLWVLGATSHMGNNNRWAREGGVIDELLVENMYRNPEGNAIIFDLVLLDKVIQEPNITLLLNTAVYEVEKDGPEHIRALRAFCSQNSTEYRLEAPLF